MRRTTTLTIMAIAFVGLMLASPDSGRAENPAVGAPAKTPTADEVAALQHEVDALQHEVDQLRHEHAELGSGKTPSESIRISRYRIHEILVQVDRLEKVLEEKAGSMQELQRLRDQMEDTSIVTAEDLAKEAAKKAAAKGLKQVVSAAVGKAIGWVGVAAKVVTYGGRWVIQELNVSSIEEMLRNEQITINDVNKLQSALLNERNHEQRKLDRLKALREQLDDKDTKRIVKKHELEQAQARARLLESPASRHAVTERETDAAGDREEAIRAAVTPSRPPLPPRRTGAPPQTRSKSGKPAKKQTAVKKKSTASQRGHATGASTAVEFGVGVGLGILLNRGGGNRSQRQGGNWNR